MKTWLEISKERLVGNLRAVQALAGSGTETLAVIKANAYGHDAALVARVLTAAGVRWLGVTDADEGALVRAEVGETARILVMSGMEAADAEQLVEHGLTPVVWTVEHIDALEHAAAAARQPVRVHLEIDTGMSRQGAGAAEIAAIAQRLARSQWVVCEGLMSHLSSAEVAGSEQTAAQRSSFANALQVAEAAGLRPQFVHLGNTSAVDEGSTMEWMLQAAAQMDAPTGAQTAKPMGARAMVRTGLGLYGYCLPVECGGEGRLAAQVRPVLTWKTRVIGARELAPGATVGYGATFRAAHKMRVALLPVGYADGFRRAGSSGCGNGWVMLRGARAAVLGRVSMNLVVVDVTAVPGASVGDEVVLLGDGVTAADIARWSGTIPYDILCGIRAQPVLM